MAFDPDAYLAQSTFDPDAYLSQGKPAKKPSFRSMLKDEAMASLPGGVVRGLKDVVDTGAEFLAKGYDALAPQQQTLSSLVTGKPVSEAERIKAMNEAGKSEFKGAMERTGNVVGPTVGRIGGNILATQPAIGLLGAGATAANLPRLGAAIASGGMSTGARVAPGLASKAADLGIRVAGGATAGGVSAGLVEPESAGVGALIGGALPPVVQGAGALGRGVGHVFSDRSARLAATNKLSEALGDDVSQVIGDIQTYYPKRAENIPVSAAGITQNPVLATLEQGSRVRGSPLWNEFDQRQAKAVFENVMKATDEAAQIGERAGARRENWQAAWQKAAESQKPKLWQGRMMEFADNIDRAAVSSEASNPAVRGVLDAISNEIDRVGPNFTIGHLQQIRANLSGRASPISQDAFKAAPRDSAAVKSIIKEIDDILNVSTGGKWQKVIEGYAKDSEKLHAAKAAEKVRGAFIDRETGRTLGVAADADIPKITEAGLGRAMNAARMPDKTLALSGEANQRLEATLDALRRQNILQRVKKTATGGGGSDTISNKFAAGAATSAGAPNMLMQILEGLRHLGTRKTDAQLAQLLANPDELAAALSSINQPTTTNALSALMYKSAPLISARP